MKKLLLFYLFLTCYLNMNAMDRKAIRAEERRLFKQSLLRIEKLKAENQVQINNLVSRMMESNKSPISLLPPILPVLPLPVEPSIMQSSLNMVGSFFSTASVPPMPTGMLRLMAKGASADYLDIWRATPFTLNPLHNGLALVNLGEKIIVSILPDSTNGMILTGSIIAAGAYVYSKLPSNVFSYDKLSKLLSNPRDNNSHSITNNSNNNHIDVSFTEEQKEIVQLRKMELDASNRYWEEREARQKIDKEETLIRQQIMQEKALIRQRYMNNIRKDFPMPKVHII